MELWHRSQPLNPFSAQRLSPMLRSFLVPRQLPAPCLTLPFSSHHYSSQSIPPDTPLMFLLLRLQCNLTLAVFPPLQHPSTLPCQATTLDLFPPSPPPLLGCMVAMALLCLLHSSPPGWYPLCSLLRHNLSGLVWMPGGIHWEGGTVRALPWQPCLCCLC